jgi:hypothetical protein
MLALAGCASLKDEIPSFWDPNEVVAITDIQLAVHHLNCGSNEYTAQVSYLKDRTEWLMLYSTSKGSRDLLKIEQLFNDSLQGLKPDSSKFFCVLKKPNLTNEIDNIAKGAQSRVNL